MTTTLNVAKIFFLLLSLMMVWLVVKTSQQSNLWTLAQNFHTQDPWFGTTLWDYYFNVAILAFWVWYRESQKWAAVGWTILFVTLGSIASCFYVFWILNKIQPGDSLSRVLAGDRA